MPIRSLAAEVQQLIASLESTEQLEVLLFLLGAPRNVHTIDTITTTFGIGGTVAEQALKGLQRQRLIEFVNDAFSTNGYRYAPATIQQHAAVEGLAAAFQNNSIAIIKAICTKPSAALRSFADAFRVRGKNIP
jgi:hypothetical protein